MLSAVNFSETYGVTIYGSGWKKGVVNSAWTGVVLLELQHVERAVRAFIKVWYILSKHARKHEARPTRVKNKFGLDSNDFFFFFFPFFFCTGLSNVGVYQRNA